MCGTPDRPPTFTRKLAWRPSPHADQQQSSEDIARLVELLNPIDPLVSTEALITKIPEKEKAPAMPGGGMGGMDY